MTWRFYKRIPILGGLFRLNLSKGGVSVSAGSSPATVNVSRTGIRTTLTIPGTGLSWIQRWRKK